MLKNQYKLYLVGCVVHIRMQQKGPDLTKPRCCKANQEVVKREQMRTDSHLHRATDSARRAREGMHDGGRDAPGGEVRRAAR